MKVKKSILEKVLKKEVSSLPEEVSLSFDTRTLKKGDLFVGIDGENFKGVSFLNNAFRKGAVAAIVNGESHTTDQKKVLSVPDTIKFIGELAAARLHYWKTLSEKKRIIAITGSNGKTTTKELISHTLEKIIPGKYSSTKGNFNNFIGVPITAFNLDDDKDYAVFEIGTNKPGEIEYLAKLLQPDIGIITSIGESHLEFFQNTNNVFKEKKALFDITEESSGLAPSCFFHSFDEHLKDMPKKEAFFRCGHGENDLDILNLKNNLIEFSCNNENHSFCFSNLKGEHNYLNMINAFSALVFGLGFNPKTVLDAMKDFDLKDNRGEWRTIGQTKFFLDCYNSNPTSFKASVKSFLSELKFNTENVLFIVGEMYELGVNSGQFHREIGEFLKQHQVKNVVFVGNFEKEFSDGLSHRVIKFKSVSDISKNDINFSQFSTVYLKGSRGVGLEKLIDLITK